MFLTVTTAAPIQASIEGLLFFLLIIGVSALSSWLKRKQEQKQEGAPPPEAGEEGAPPRKRFDWEEELRRLIEGNRPESDPTKPPPPPPVIRPVLEETAEPPRPPVVGTEVAPGQRRPRAARPLPAKEPVKSVADSFHRELAGRRDAIHHRIGRLKVSWAKRAEEMDAAVAERTAGWKRLRSPGMVPRTTRTLQGNRRQASPAVRHVLASLSRPSSAAEAIIAAEILGQPKGLQR